MLTGFALLMGGGDWVVRACVRLASALGISSLVVSVTVIGFGTSLPELLTSLDAAAIGAPGISIGNVIGSNIANIWLILGAGALMAPIQCSRGTTIRDGGVMLVASVAVALVVVNTGGVSRIAGAVFVLALTAYLIAIIVVDSRAYKIARAANTEPQSSQPPPGAAGVPVPSSSPGAAGGSMPSSPPGTIWKSLAVALIGLGAIALGAHWLVDGAVELAERFGVPETVIGLTVIAVGSSLPELAATLAAARHGEAEVAYGNIIGSNLFNLLAVLGITAIVVPIGATDADVRVDFLVMLAAAAMLLLLGYTRGQVSRVAGGVMLVSYGAYIVTLI